MRHAVAIAGAALTTGHSVNAAVSVGPDACPVSVSADQYNIADDVAADDLNSWRDVGAHALVIIDIPVAQVPRTHQLFLRYVADPQSGEVLGPARGRCDQPAPGQ